VYLLIYLYLCRRKISESYETDIDDTPVGWGDDCHSAGED
jgi:hypothetical protein